MNFGQNGVEAKPSEFVFVSILPEWNNPKGLWNGVQTMRTAINSSSLAQINDINLKIFDEICAERFNALNLECVLISLIDKVPSDALPHLAEQYHVTGNEGQLQAVTEEEKRNLIKSSIKMHRYKGTKYALKEIFRTLNLTCDIEEWFNYGGLPYHFKVLLQISDTSISENTEERLLSSVKEYKNETL